MKGKPRKQNQGGGGGKNIGRETLTKPIRNRNYAKGGGGGNLKGCQKQKKK